MSSLAVNLPALDSEHGLRLYIKEVQRIPILSESEEKELVQKWCEDGDMLAGQKLVLSHLRLVTKVVFRFFRGYGLPLMDLISEGNIGLMKAVQKFDPQMNCRVATYATWWIKAAIQDFILKSWSMLKLSTSAVKQKLFGGSKMRQRIAALEQSREAASATMLPVENSAAAVIPASINRTNSDTMQERAVATMRPSRVISAADMNHAHNLISLDQSDDENGDFALVDRISSDWLNQEDFLIAQEENNIAKESISQAISTLTERERHILYARRLLTEPLTLEFLATVYKVSRERVRQIEEAAIKKIRKAVVAAGLAS